MAWVFSCPNKPLRSVDETQFTSLEEAWKAAVEMEEEEDAPPEETTEDEEGIGPMGVWGNTASSLAPVMGVIANGFAEKVMTNWSNDP
jgi:hypothetical protein